MYNKKTLTFTFHHYWGAFCQGAFVQGAFVLDPFSLYLNTKLKCNKQWTYLQLSGTYEK